MMRSMSSGAIPASSRAARAATAPMNEVSSPSAAIRRSLMPVRSVIQLSEVSTILARSSLVTTRWGRYPPTPLMTVRTVSNPLLPKLTLFPDLRGALKLEVRVEARHIACEALNYAVRSHVIGKVDRAGEAGGIGSAVTFDDNTV